MKGIDMQNGVEEDQDEGQLSLEGDTCFLCYAQPTLKQNVSIN